MGPRARTIAVVVLVVLAWACYALRREVIGRFFVDGAPGAAPALVPDAGDGLGRAQAVRVVLLDGLSRRHAAELPVLSAACARGLDLVVDVGFPTVSLPVQHALWTGLTQQQAGVQYRIGRIDPPPVTALPARVSGSIAVGESHRDIVHSFGFSRVEPGLDRDEIEAPGSVWRTTTFLETATTAIGEAATLVFVHVLRIDETGHAHGAASAQYAQAAAEADAMLGHLIAADPSPGRTRWFVLADHGHRPEGGHGDAEPEIRLVRACVFGDVESSRAEETPVHLVDLHREIAHAVGMPPMAGATGRTLAVAWENPLDDATLPRARSVDLAVGITVALASLFGAWRVLGSQVWLGVAWPLLSWLGVLWIHGAVTLSNPVVYPPLGREVLLAAVAGFVALAWGLLRLAKRAAAWRAAAGLLLPALGAWGAMLWICRVPHALAGGAPPLLPALSAMVSVLATILAGAFAVAAVVVLVGRRDLQR